MSQHMATDGLTTVDTSEKSTGAGITLDLVGQEDCNIELLDDGLVMFCLRREDH
jgi:hypothetical protein